LKLAVCSVGRRVELIRWMRKIMNPEIEIVAIDQDEMAPALYEGNYYNTNDDIIKLLEYDYIISLHDEQIIELPSNNCILHPVRTTLKMCYDKKYMKLFPVNTPHTTIIKNRCGSASSGLEKISQPYLEGDEYNLQVYFDIHTEKIIDVFMQKKLLMRAGETDRSISIWKDEIFDEIVKLNDQGFRGAIDIDVIIQEKEVYIIDINPRFGGGYQMAHLAGVDFITLLKKNILGEKIDIIIGNYEEGIIFSKYPSIIQIKGERIEM
jgi:carbamoyl-phosphate synthase large subunit